jgi:putative peptidoglycan lipid II flippase
MGARALLVAAATMLSRVLGLVREQVFAALFGVGSWGDAFNIAFRIPNLLRDMFAEGSLSAAFVPTFADVRKNKGIQAAFALANIVLGAVLVVVGTITLLGILGAPWIVDLIAADKFTGDERLMAVTVLATRVMFPFLPLVSLAAVVMGQLNAEERYGMPALASSAFNVVAIAGGVAFKYAGLHEEKLVIGWSVATLAAGAAQLAIQLPSLFRAGFTLRPRVDFKDPDLRRVAMLMAPATVGLAAMQVNIIINTGFASSVVGAVTALQLAFRLIYLPIGVFGVAIGTIATTRLAQRAAEKDMSGLGETLAQGLRLVAFLTLPCMAGFIAVPDAIVRLLYEHGRFDENGTAMTAAALVFYSTGLYCYSALKVAAPAFYALGKSRVPMLGSLLAVAVNLALNFALFGRLGHRGLALGTAAAATANFAVLMIAFRAVVPSMDVAGIVGHFFRVAVAAAGCGASAWFVDARVEAALGHATFVARALDVGAAVVAGGAAYFVLCKLLGVKELAEILARARRRKPSGTITP